MLERADLLIKQLFVYDVEEVVSFQVSAQVFAEEVRLPPAYDRRDHVRRVRADYDALELPQRTLPRQRLDLEDVQRCPREAPVSESLDERFFVHHRPPSDVHEVGSRFYGLQGPGIDEVPGLRRARQRDGHVVGFAESIVEAVRRVELVGV